jgi:Mg2+-importing ATPase
VLPYTPLAAPLGFTPLPALYFLFLLGMIVIYLLLVELVKHRLMRRYA